MIKTFIHESDDFVSDCGQYAGQIEIDVEIEAHNNQEVDYKILAITNLENDKSLELKDFSKEEQMRILDRCNEYADWHASDAIDDWKNRDVDSWVDWCKENN